MNSEIAKRLDKAIKYLIYKGIADNQLEIADIMGANKVSVSGAVNGNAKCLTKSFLKRFSKAFGVNIEWLENGVGYMTNEEGEDDGEDVVILRRDIYEEMIKNAESLRRAIDALTDQKKKADALPGDNAEAAAAI